MRESSLELSINSISCTFIDEFEHHSDANVILMKIDE